AWYRFLACVSIGVGAWLDFPPAPILDCVASPQEMSKIGKAGPFLAGPEIAIGEFPAIAVFRDLYGFVPNVFRGQTARPKVIEAEAQALRLLLSTEDHLSRRQKEQILVAVSGANGNNYFVAVHSEILSALGVPLETSDRIA